jgi:hypothetical protein
VCVRVRVMCHASCGCVVLCCVGGGWMGGDYSSVYVHRYMNDVTYFFHYVDLPEHI